MKVRPWAEFTSDLPDDHIEDDTDIVQFGGKSVTEAIAEMLKRCGCEVSEPIYLHEKGWELAVKAGKRPLMCRITIIDEYLFVFDQASWLDKMFGRHSTEYIDALKRLGQELGNDPRFHNVRWHPVEDILEGKPGTESPIID